MELWVWACSLTTVSGHAKPSLSTMVRGCVNGPNFTSLPFPLSADLAQLHYTPQNRHGLFAPCVRNRHGLFGGLGALADAGRQAVPVNSVAP